MNMLQQKWRRLREAAAVAGHGATAGDRATLFTSYLRLLVQPPGTRTRTVSMRIGTLVHPVTFRESDIFTFGEILFEQQYRLPERLPPGAVIMSAGANIGIMSLMLLGMYPDATLHVFEPDPVNAGLLRTNLSGIARATVHECALGDADGTLTLHFGAHQAEHSLIAGAEDHGGVAVRCRRLDGVMAELGVSRIALLKVDVEGSEVAVMRGLGDRVRDVDVVVGEFHESIVREEDFYPWLEATGFRITVRERALDGGPVHLFRLDR
jgi:FkbM family methyltransferase